ncbi:protein kinase domain-containing protein [Nostoc sp. CMAA1605]|uniref:protein kinase domain-containing protein n=1 Tax=Nostoc sp. CMAA1605 TaxID=2055159 RepID=UPI001F38342A|nr:YARHG domain-containing protein [Nostoc sp. CMAA1605]MCF4965992.1 serine/threonine protein kinase [Nostoc sp. CMAA1605]
MTIQMLNDRYQVIQTLGAGGFGETYLAEDTYMPSKRRCVVKQLRPIQNNPQIYQLVQERFQREAAILEELGGKTGQIPALYAYFSADGQFYLIQEWIEGDTLTAKVRQQGLLSENTVREILLNVLPVLDYVHSQQIVHRDIKPDNIMVRHGDGKPVLIDFGAVRESMGTVVNSQGHATSSIVIGTPGYMPSEQAAGRPVYSSDLYSLGLTAVYLLTGMQPQNLETDSQTGEIIWRNYAQNISPVLASVIDRAIAYHPRDRFPSAKAMLEALQRDTNSIPPTQPYSVPPVISHTAQPTTPVLPQATVTDNQQKNILIGSLVAGGLIGGSVILGFILTKPPQHSSEQPVVKETTSPVSQSLQTKVSKNVVPQTQSPSNVDTSQIVNSFTPPPENNQSNYLWLSERLVTDADLNGKDGYTLDIMRNTIFARHGRRFDTPELQAYFNTQTWYQSIYSPREFPLTLLSRLEQQNVDRIQQYQDRYNLRHFK